MKNVFKVYSRQDRLDKFWKEIISNFFDASDLMSFLMMVFVLSHGQAKVETGFSMNECLVVNMTEKSMVAQRKLYEGGISKVDITKRMIHYVRNSLGRYMEDLESNKKKNEEEHKQNATKRNMQIC